MTRLPQEIKNYIELNSKISNRPLADKIFEKFKIKTTHTTVGKEKNEILERKARKVERIEVVPPLLPKKTVITPRKIQPKYQQVTKGDLVNIVAEVLEGKIDLDPKLMERLQKGYPKAPFGGSRKTKDGGWNSITYAIFEVILRSGCVYIKVK